MDPLKFIKRAASLGMALLLLIGMIPGTALADTAADGTLTLEATVKVEVQQAGETSGAVGVTVVQPEDTISVKLVAEKASNPMPDDVITEEDGSRVAYATVNGAGTATFGTITFVQDGEYAYTVEQVAGVNTRYTYATEVYKVKVYAYHLNGKVKISCCVYPADAEETEEAKVGEMSFLNLYTVPEPEVSPSPSPSTKPDPSPSPSPDPSTEPDPDPTPTPTTSPSPSPTPTPSTSPTPTPSEEPTPTPSEEPTPTPTEEPTPSPEPSEKPEWRHDDEPIKVPPDHEAPVLMDELPDPNDPDAPNFVTIIEDGVPLTFMKTEDPETGEMIYVLIEDEPVPEAYDPQYVDDTTNPDGSPKTGDETNNTPWIVLVCAAAAGLIGCAVYLAVPKKRKR